MDYFQILSTVMPGDIKAPSLFVIMLDYEERPKNYRGGAVTAFCFCSMKLGKQSQLLHNGEISKVGLLLNAKAIYFY